MLNQSCPQYDLEVPYGDRPGMTYDVYGTNLPENSPIFVFIHGGYWQMTSKSDNLFIVKPLVDAKVRVVMLGYDLCPSITLEELYNEVYLFHNLFLIIIYNNIYYYRWKWP